MAGNVGAARDFFAGHCNLPRVSVDHYVAVIKDPAGDLAAISTCCDRVDDVIAMLSGALAAITSGTPLTPESNAVIVSRDDLRAALGSALIPDAVRRRLREALGGGGG